MSNLSNSVLQLPEDFSEWDSLPEKAYELIFSQSKDRFEECLSESESITNKSIKFIIAIITFIAAFVAAIICYRIPSGIIIVITSLGLLDIILWAKLIFPKSIIHRGSNPFEMFNTDLNKKDFTEQDKIRLVYYQECIRYADRITWMDVKNVNRIKIYKFAIWAFLVSLFLVLLIYLVYVFHL